MQGYIVGFPDPDAGLGNRIKCIVSILRIAKKLNRTPLLYWKKSFSCGADFNDLFETKINLIDDEKLDLIKKSQDYVIYKEYPINIDLSKKYIFFDTWRLLTFPGEVPMGFSKVFPNEKGDSIDLEFERIPKNIKEEFLVCFKKLKPKKEIISAVSDFIKKQKFDSNMVGLHVRRNEFVLNSRGKVSSNEKFFIEMQNFLSENENARFFLATDSKLTEKDFIEKFPSKVIIYPKTNLDRENPQTIKEAFIELLILSKTNNIFGTYLSTFSEMAWWLGNCSAKVKIIGLGDVKTKFSKNSSVKIKIKGILSIIMQYLRRKSKIFRAILRLFKVWA